MSHNSRIEFAGNIVGVRAVEDSIRSTKKYTEGIGTIRKKHPIQGEDFPSKMFCKYYEVYPGLDVRQGEIWEKSAGTWWSWQWGEIRHIDVLFNYDYRENKATVIVQDGADAVTELARAIPGFSDALARVITGQSDHSVS